MKICPSCGRQYLETRLTCAIDGAMLVDRASDGDESDAITNLVDRDFLEEEPTFVEENPPELAQATDLKPLPISRPRSDLTRQEELEDEETAPVVADEGPTALVDHDGPTKVVEEGVQARLVDMATPAPAPLPPIADAAEVLAAARRRTSGEWERAGKPEPPPQPPPQPDAPPPRPLVPMPAPEGAAEEARADEDDPSDSLVAAVSEMREVGRKVLEDRVIAQQPEEQPVEQSRVVPLPRTPSKKIVTSPVSRKETFEEKRAAPRLASKPADRPPTDTPSANTPPAARPRAAAASPPKVEPPPGNEPVATTEIEDRTPAVEPVVIEPVVIKPEAPEPTGPPTPIVIESSRPEPIPPGFPRPEEQEQEDDDPDRPDKTVQDVGVGVVSGTIASAARLEPAAEVAAQPGPLARDFTELVLPAPTLRQPVWPWFVAAVVGSLALGFVLGRTTAPDPAPPRAATARDASTPPDLTAAPADAAIPAPIPDAAPAPDTAPPDQTAHTAPAPAIQPAARRRRRPRRGRRRRGQRPRTRAKVVVPALTPVPGPPPVAPPPAEPPPPPRPRNKRTIDPFAD